MRSVNVPPTSTPRRFMNFSSGRGGGCWTTRGSRDQDQLAEELAALHAVEGRADLGQRVGLCDLRLEQAAAREVEHVLDLLARIDERTDDGPLAAEERDHV